MLSRVECWGTLRSAEHKTDAMPNTDLELPQHHGESRKVLSATITPAKTASVTMR